MLTLMKGDKTVELAEEGADTGLLIIILGQKEHGISY